MVFTSLALYLRQMPPAPVFDLSGERVREVELPLVFRLPIRVDIIRRAFHSAFTAGLQPKGRDPLAGKRRVGESWGIGYSVARVPRLDTGRAVLAPNVRGGRTQFAPTTLERIHEEINRAEMRIALLSALAATTDIGFVRRRGHIVPQNIKSLPVVVVDDFENIETTRSLRQFLERTGLWLDVERAQSGLRIRSGKGKMRGRRYKEPKSLLFIVSSEGAKVVKAIRNLPGVDWLTPKTLNILALAPGGTPGRLTVITERALNITGEIYRVEGL